MKNKRLWMALVAGVAVLGSGLAAQDPVLEIGVIGGGGLTLGFGDWETQLQAELANRGSLAGGPGSSVRELSPSWQGGAYFSLSLTDWMRIGTEARMQYLGTSFLASTDGGQVWSRTSLAVPVVLLPLSAHFAIPHALGELDIGLGPALAILAGQATLVETQLGASSSRTIRAPDIDQAVFAMAGLSVQGRFRSELGWLGIGLAYDVALSPFSPTITNARYPDGLLGVLGAPWHPMSISLFASWGVEPNPRPAKEQKQ